ncbi:hypothetical protein lerEdw1_003965 [Lerista edwardsae]|nr:hypothetical protein lerEdw1_003965 [Lerista edwardsae]
MRARGRARAKWLAALLAANACLYALVEVSRLLRGPRRRAAIVPRGRFWRRPVASRAYWNRQQQRLERLHNPILAALGNGTAAERAAAPGPCGADPAVALEVRGFGALPRRFQDFLRYLRCRDHALLLDQPGKCRPRAPFLLLAIKSLVPHLARRQAIRKTWGREVGSGDATVARVFLLGRTPPEEHQPDFSEVLRFESEAHGDILLWDYLDTFFNLTLKEVLFMRWASRACPGARFVFKGDDDVFVNIHAVLDYLRTLTPAKAGSLFVGDVIEKAKPKRKKIGKYYIPESIYRGFYPPYAGGAGFLFSGNLLPNLTSVSDQVVLYPIDDVYTGMCLQRLGLAPEKHRGFKTFDIKKKYRNNICNYTSLFLVHQRKPQELVRIWKNLQDPFLILRC